MKHIMSERNVLLGNLNHPFLIGLHYSFQTRAKLYFVLDYVNGGTAFFVCVFFVMCICGVGFGTSLFPSFPLCGSCLLCPSAMLDTTSRITNVLRLCR